MARSHVPALLCGALLGCNDPGTAPLPPQTIGYNFTNAPAELPNVLRSGGRVVSAFVDLEQDLLVVVGAPEDPTTDRLCGGAELRQFVPVQWVGDFADIVKQLAMLDEINILVYQPVPESPIIALCVTEPIATGTGRYLRTDNDFFGAFGRANAVFEHVQGTVLLAGGDLARLSARFHALGSPGGELKRFETTVQLQPVGKP